MDESSRLVVDWRAPCNVLFFISKNQLLMSFLIFDSLLGFFPYLIHTSKLRGVKMARGVIHMSDISAFTVRHSR